MANHRDENNEAQYAQEGDDVALASGCRFVEKKVSAENPYGKLIDASEK